MKKRYSILAILLIFSILLASTVLAAPKNKNVPGQNTGTGSTTDPTPQVIVYNNTIVQQPSSTPTSDIPWEMIGVILAIIGAIVGWLISRMVRGKTAKYMTEIDKTYRTYNKNTTKCESELADLKEKIEDDFKKGKINDQSLALLDSRIDKYAKELRSGIIGKKFTALPEDIGKTIKHMLSDGVITKEEYTYFSKTLKSSKMNTKDKAELNKIMQKWQKEDRR